MEHYVAAKQEPITNHPLGTLIRHTIPEAIRQLPFIHADLLIQGSIGLGNWATVPWIALLDRRHTNTTRRGEYIVYLFAHDMSAVYLTLAQGVTVPKEERGRPGAYQYLREKAEQIRKLIPLEGMQKDQNIKLTAAGLGQDYEVSTVAYYRYNRDQLPSNEQLIADLRNLVENYKLYIEHEEEREEQLEVEPETEVLFEEL